MNKTNHYPGAFRFLLLTFVLAVAAGPAFSQVLGGLRGSTEPVQITGILRFAGGGPANEVVVRLEALSGGVVGEVRTDRLGKFSFSHLSPEQYHVYVRYPGYREIQREVNLVMVASEYLQLELQPEERGNNSAKPAVISATVPKAATAEFQQATTLIAKGETKKAIPHLEKSIAIYPSYVEARLKLGTAYMDLQQWARAERVLRQALALDKKTANIYFALGEIYWRQKKYHDSEDVLLKGLAIESRSWQGHFTLGRLYFSTAELAKAGRHLAIAIQLNPNLAEAHLLAGNVLLRAEKSEDAVSEFQEYLRLAPDGEYVTQARAAIYRIKNSTSKP